MKDHPVAVAIPDLEASSAQEVLAFAVERFHPQLTMACSFQKEESVLVHMLSAIEPRARVFTIDTGVLFPETLATWKRFEDRFGLHVEVLDARSPDQPWTAERCCGQSKVDALERALEGVEAWITGVRREQGPTRAAAGKLERDERRGIWKLNPLADWSEKDLWRYIHEHDLPYHPLHDRGYGSIGCAPCTAPGEGREGRWAGTDKTECGIHV
ncbi:MAG: phosphoadenylyl-sulfate reductase [Solirubrobacterales bacterium]|nr:phosphoadenylyl-sulfate reductase [Solirubrobacterales bacterium]MBV9474129.1 phosphoadenylyl-sulfate reductase [Solirubrobacterales bacterium]